MKIAIRTYAMNNHDQYCKHYANEIIWLLEQSPAYFIAGNPNALTWFSKIVENSE